MQTKKRFTEINIWESNWFMNMDNTQKLFWLYLNDRCDNVGVWTPNFKLATFHLNEEIESKEFLDSFFKILNEHADKLIKLDNSNWFLTEFVKFQYCNSKPLNRKSPPHKSYIKLIKERGLLKWFSENQPEVLPKELKDTSKRSIDDLSKNSSKDIKKKIMIKINPKNRDTDEEQESE